ncbi:kinase-like protein [Abortiporus biennis]|nr:kinase-like protein [Abortiporus biennis]
MLSRLFSAVRCSLTRHTQESPFIVRVTRKAEAEPQEQYRPGGYHPIAIGDVFSERYCVVEQIGWSFYSTVWHVEDFLTQSRAAMKVIASRITKNKAGWDERGCMIALRDQNPQAPGHGHICQLFDTFMVDGPNGRHICLIIEIMGPTVLDIYCCSPRSGFKFLPLFLVKRISQHVLLALQYMHETCNIVHTDIKGNDIFMTGIPSTPVLPEMLEITDHAFKTTTFKLGDFSKASRMSNRRVKLIQPTTLRAPEVLVGAEWDVKADIFNLGCLIYELVCHVPLFNPEWNQEKTGFDAPQTHLAQMIALLGEFPQSLLAKGTATEKYFDSEGNLLKGPGEYKMTLHKLLSRTPYPRKEHTSMVDFISKALIIDPVERWSASQLLAHPWLHDVR